MKAADMELLHQAENALTQMQTHQHGTDGNEYSFPISPDFPDEVAEELKESIKVEYYWVSECTIDRDFNKVIVRSKESFDSKLDEVKANYSSMTFADVEESCKEILKAARDLRSIQLEIEIINSK